MLVVHLKLLALVCIVELNVVCGLKCAYMMDGRYVDFENTVCATAVEFQCLPSSVHFQAVPRAQISPLIKPSGCKNPTEDGREITCFCDTDHCNRNFTRLLAELESKNILGQDPGRLLKCFKRLKRKYGDEGARFSEVFPLTENDKKAHESGSRLAKRSGSLIAENPGQSHVEKREMPEKSSVNTVVIFAALALALLILVVLVISCLIIFQIKKRRRAAAKKSRRSFSKEAGTSLEDEDFG